MAGAKHRHAVGAQLGDIALIGRVVPHLFVHGRRHRQRAGARGGQGGDQVVTVAMRQARQHIGGGGRNQKAIGPAGQLDMRHIVVRACIPQIHIHRPARQRLEGHRGDKAGGGFAHRHVHGVARLDQQADEFGGFIGGHAARDAKQDVLSGHGLVLSISKNTQG